MSRWLVEKQLSASAERLRALRNELAVIDEQLAALDGEAAVHDVQPGGRERVLFGPAEPVDGLADGGQRDALR